jgi:serine/threonine protein kinase
MTVDDAEREHFARLEATLFGDPWIGRVIADRYRVTQRLGEGGMGAVFEAEHLQLRKSVALKVILSELAGHDEIAARFVREAMASAHIEHPNIVATLDFGTLDEGGAYLVMQLVRGPTLREYLKEHGPLPWRTVCEIAAQVADAISAAHATGVIHRDLKPENIVLTTPHDGAGWLVKVLDFGVAHVKSHAQAPRALDTSLTRAGMVIGTPGYMPPEQAMGTSVDETADLYALGIIIWELLTGRPPFDAETLSEIVRMQLEEHVLDVPTMSAPDVPEALSTLLRGMLAPSPAGRPHSALQVRDTLRALLAPPVIEVSPLALAPTTFEPAFTSSVTYTTQTQRVAGHQIAALVVIAIAILGAFLYWYASTRMVDDAGDDVSGAVEGSVDGVDIQEEDPSADGSTTALAAHGSEPGARNAKRDRSAAGDGPTKPRKRAKKATRAKSSSEKPRPMQRLRRALDGLMD